MKESLEFMEGIAYAMQCIRDFELKHGHIHLDAVAANTFSEQFKEYAIAFRNKQFEVVKRESPCGDAFLKL